MAENSVSATEANRSASVSRLTNRQSEEQVDRETTVRGRQQSNQAVRDKAAVETQLGRSVDVSA